MSSQGTFPAAENAEPKLARAQQFHHLSLIVLAASVWGSTLLFGLYILAYYALPLFGGDLNAWNETLNNLYSENAQLATSGIGAHFIAGGVILVMGCVQLLGSVRRALPRLHRWLGRAYVSAALATAVGGLIFVVSKGTIGGWVMDIGFGLYGSLMLVCAVMTIKLARAQDFQRHRAWALRLFALAIGSWLYRLEYGFWHLFTGNIGHTESFNGWFDYIMDFFFFIPNLLVVELIIRSSKDAAKPLLVWLSVATLWVATGFIALGTYAFTSLYWGPAILAALP